MEPSESLSHEWTLKELCAPIIEQEKQRTIESRIDENTFVDKTSGRLFRRYQYFGYTVIQDIETGFINAGSFVLAVGRMQGKQRQLKDFKRTYDYQIAIELTRELMKNDSRLEPRRFPPGPTVSEIESYMLRVFNEGYGDSVRGTYVPIPVFQLVALWADKRHKLEVLVLLANINDKAYTEQLANPETHHDAYDEIKKLNEQLIKETEELRLQIKEKDEVIKMKEELIRVSNTPINRIISTEAIYAKPYGERSFALRVHRQPLHSDNINPPRLRSINLNNSNDVKSLAMKYLENEGLVFSEDGHRLFLRDNLDFVFEAIENIARNTPVEMSLMERRERFISTELERLHSLIPTGTVLGDIYELEYIREHEELIPWKALPQSIINTYHENRNDTGIDAVILDENKQITLIAQIKHHSNNYLRDKEIRNFLSKCREERYADVQKRLILHNCILSRTMRRTINELGIELIEINDTSEDE